MAHFPFISEFKAVNRSQFQRRFPVSFPVLTSNPANSQKKVSCVGNSAHDHVLTNAIKQLVTFPSVG